MREYPKMSPKPTTGQQVLTALEGGLFAEVIETRRNVGALEYRMVWGLVAVLLIAGLTTFSTDLAHALTNIATHL
jgi:Flp pilus assembly pilin Flp